MCVVCELVVAQSLKIARGAPVGPHSSAVEALVMMMFERVDY